MSGATPETHFPLCVEASLFPKMRGGQYLLIQKDSSPQERIGA